MKKALCLILAVLMLIGLCACGKCACCEGCCDEQGRQIENLPQTDQPIDPPDDPSNDPSTDDPQPSALTFEAPQDDRQFAYCTLFVYDGENTPVTDGVDYSQCQVGSLYYLSWETWEVELVTDQEVSECVVNLTHVFYVKKAEPTKIYATPVDDFSISEVIYESEHGKINHIECGYRQYQHTALQILEGRRRLVWLNLLTGETKVLMEQYYILNTAIEDREIPGGKEAGYLDIPDINYIFFNGKKSEEDTEYMQYYYCTDTGEYKNAKEFAQIIEEYYRTKNGE